MKFNQQISTIFLIFVIQLNLGLCKRIRKRQIYREQVQPHTGGKIPESAFETDRLLLNRLQKEGIAVPDGIMLEQRNPKVFPYSHNDLRPVFKVLATSDNRFTGDAGDIFQTISPVGNYETTYPIPRITEDTLQHAPIQTTIYHPIYKTFLLPNPYLQDPALAAVPQKDFHAPFTSFRQSIQSPLSIMSFEKSNHKYPHYHSTLKYIHEDYVTSQIFNDLSSFMEISFGMPLR